jgi:hypothetical protein
VSNQDYRLTGFYSVLLLIYSHTRRIPIKKLFLTVAVLYAVLTVTALPHKVRAATADYFDTVQKVYIGYYQRPADPEGLLYWAGRLNSTNGNLNEIIEAYANSPESQALYGTINSSTISSVINAIYRTLFGRDAETGGLNYYVNGFNTGRFTAATIMLNVLYGAQNQDLQSVTNKVTTSDLFTRTIDPELDGYNFQYSYSGNAAAQGARDFLSAVTSNPSTIPTKSEIVAYLSVPIIQFLGAFSEIEDYSGDLKLLGEVQNNGDATVSFVEVTCNFYDTTSKLIGTDYTYLVGSVVGLSSGIYTNTALRPSEKGAFEVWTSIKNSTVATYDCSATYETYDTTEPEAQLAIVGNVKAQSDYFDDLELLGQVKNIGTKGLIFGEVYFIVRNSAGKILDIDFNYINGETVPLPDIGSTTDTALRVNSQGTFDVSTLVPFSSYGSYEAKYDWTDADITNGIAATMLRAQESSAEIPVVIDQKARWDLRNQEVQRMYQLLKQRRPGGRP